jgi:hypothetical protein
MNFPQMMLDTMDEITYAFYLAYGMTPEDEELDSLLDVEMYNMMDTDSGSAFEACDSSVLLGDTPKAKATRFEF